jgi:hypothetical protein
MIKKLPRILTVNCETVSCEFTLTLHTSFLTNWNILDFQIVSGQRMSRILKATQ